MANIDATELGKWEKGEANRWRVTRAWLGFWYNHVPKLFGWTLTPVRLIFGSLRGLFFLVVSLAPVWIKFYDQTSTLTWPEAGLYSGVLAGLLTYNLVYDRVIKDYKPKTVGKALRRRLSWELCGVTTHLQGNLKIAKKECQSEIDAVRVKVLECIRDVARIHLGDYEGACVEATLLLFADPNGETIRVANRTTHSRPTGKIKPSAEVMAYYVARNRKHRAVHDFLRDPHPFPKTGLSSGDPPSYRSILLIPLIDAAPTGPDTCVGVVTVDSTRPYHFWPGNGESLLVQLKPYCSLLTFLLKLGEPYSVKCDS